MSNLTFHKQDLPFLLGGAGEVAIDIAKLNPLSTVDDKTASLFDVSFNAGGEKFRFGKPDTVAVSVSSTANADLTLIFPSSTGDAAARLKTSGLTDFFSNGANA